MLLMLGEYGGLGWFLGDNNVWYYVLILFLLSEIIIVLCFDYCTFLDVLYYPPSLFIRYYDVTNPSTMTVLTPLL